MAIQRAYRSRRARDVGERLASGVVDKALPDVSFRQSRKRQDGRDFRRWINSRADFEESRVHYMEAAAIYRKLAQGDPARYADYIAAVEASLQRLEEKAHSQ